MGLGLQGHLLALANTDLYRYMSQGHDVTMMAVLLGMAAARRGSMHAPIAKMLCLHIPALHPPTFTELELEVPWLGQGLGLGLGLGLGFGFGLGLAANPNPTLTLTRCPRSCRPPRSSASACSTRAPPTG